MKAMCIVLFAAGSFFASSAQQAGTPAPSPVDDTLTGVLMDAGCSALSSRASAATLKTYSGDRAKTASEADPPTTGGSTRVEQSATTSSTGAPGSTSATTGSVAEHAGTKVDSKKQSTDATAASTAQRSRTAEAPKSTSEALFSTVREKYGECMVNANTNRFALHSDGKLIMIDPASSGVIRQQMRSEGFRSNTVDSSGAPKWFSVTVTGKLQNDSMTVTSIRQ